MGFYGLKDVQDREMTVEKVAEQLGIETCLGFNPQILVPVDRIRAICRENKCGHYGENHMCPPHSGSIEQIKDRLKTFRIGWLLRYSKALNVEEDIAGVSQTRLDFHQKILHLEKYVHEKGADQVWGMIGGGCGICDICLVVADEPCRYPEKARMSLEGIAVDVGDLLDKLGLDRRFHKDKITWTGCILIE